jgi:hypothetical protein
MKFPSLLTLSFNSQLSGDNEYGLDVGGTDALNTLADASLVLFRLARFPSRYWMPFVLLLIQYL